MVTLYDEIEKGNIEMTKSLRRNLEQMITVSSNSASNTVVQTIGGGSFSKGAETVTELAKELGCSNTYEQHMLYNDYTPTNGKNRTSVKDCGLVLEKIYLQECISSECSA